MSEGRPAQSPSDGAQTPRRPRRGSLAIPAVLEVYASRPARTTDGMFVPSTEWCKEVAKKFEVSDKTIREIWNRKSWSKVTRPLWTEAEVAAEQEAISQTNDGISGHGDGERAIAKTRQPGRPRGAKDTVRRDHKRGRGAEDGSAEDMPTARLSGAASSASNDHQPPLEAHEPAIQLAAHPAVTEEPITTPHLTHATLPAPQYVHAPNSAVAVTPGTNQYDPIVTVGQPVVEHQWSGEASTDSEGAHPWAGPFAVTPMDHGIRTSGGHGKDPFGDDWNQAISDFRHEEIAVSNYHHCQPPPMKYHRHLHTPPADEGAGRGHE